LAGDKLFGACVPEIASHIRILLARSNQHADYVSMFPCH
jgi:hypothetical protein